MTDPTAPTLPTLDPHYLTVREVAERYRVHPSTVWRRVASGALPDPIYVSDRSPRWVLAEVEATMRARRLSPRAAMNARRSGQLPFGKALANRGP